MPSDLKEKEMEEAGTLELYELHYSDLMSLSSDRLSSSSSSEELERLESISRTITETLGPSGPGLLSITGVPNISNLRHYLLPLARKLALLNNDDRKRVLKEHSLGSDVPLKNLNRSVSSFAMQLKYAQGLELTQSKEIHEDDGNHKSKQDHLDIDSFGEFQDSEYKNLRNTFKELGFCMMELGLRLARICDRAIGDQELEQSLLESCAAKGRLIHYHSTLDNLILKEVGTRKGSTKGLASYKRDQEQFTSNRQKPAEGPKLDISGSEAKSYGSLSNLWQQWHYDYGIFTVLTSPLFISSCHSPTTKVKDHLCMSCEQECPSPSGHTYLQIFDPNKNNVLTVKSAPESFIVQVGESADILSKGRLRSTLHSVCRPANIENLSRETFVVFLQPAWSKTFSISDYPMDQLRGRCSGVCNEETHFTEQELNKLTQDIHKIVPPLPSRLKDGMTFAEFSRETTKQYYGGSGLQSKR
ncbi:hypothetical protein L1049_003966 [Liquidambar formosana]|uniref:Isopenicillin N synthase-like Fe(2+) 2OG dioxygenase domain-containing protein n=1 Tax=Liquidambar formosana TaxID=63359 RepID=A0AAP0RNB2_LIQFO